MPLADIIARCDTLDPGEGAVEGGEGVEPALFGYGHQRLALLLLQHRVEVTGQLRDRQFRVEEQFLLLHALLQQETDLLQLNGRQQTIR